MKHLRRLLPAITSQIILTALAVALSAFAVESVYAQEKDGVKDGGGGNVILFQGQTQPILLDRLMLHPELAVIKNSGELQIDSSTQVHSEFEALKPRDIQRIEQAKLKLDSWISAMHTPQQKPSRELLRMIKYAVQHTPYLRTSYIFKIQNQYYLPENLKNQNPQVKTAILFVYGYGALISSRLWDSLDADTQTGLIIHEAVRQMQVQFQNTFDDIQNEQIQLITAAIMDGHPLEIKKFDDWMSPSLYRFCLYKDTEARKKSVTQSRQLSPETEYIIKETENISVANIQPEGNAFLFTDYIFKISIIKMLRNEIQDKIQKF